MSLSIGASNATFIYVRRGVVLMYFIVEERFEAFETEMGASDWLKLREKQCARTNASLVAADRIDANKTLPSHIMYKLCFCISKGCQVHCRY
jgi:hypothetical protein